MPRALAQGAPLKGSGDRPAPQVAFQLHEQERQPLRPAGGAHLPYGQALAVAPTGGENAQADLGAQVRVLTQQMLEADWMELAVNIGVVLKESPQHFTSPVLRPHE